MKLAILAFSLLSSSAFAASINLPVITCADLGKFNAETGFEYTAKTPQPILIHDACTKAVKQRGVIADVKFASWDASKLVLSTHTTQAKNLSTFNYYGIGDGAWLIEFGSIEKARRVKSILESGKLKMLVLNPRDSAGQYRTDGMILSGDDINIWSKTTVYADQVFMVFKSAGELSQSKSKNPMDSDIYAYFKR